jgi:hypothetical protein
VSNRVAVTTIVRAAAVDRPSGYLRIVDLESGAQQAAPLPDAVHRARDPNPRGGLRGGRGIAATGDRMAVAINDRILVLGRDWSLETVISHRWMGGLHDLAVGDEGIWATSADNDLLLRFGWEGRLRDHWHWRTDRGLCRALGLGRLPRFERWPDHRDPIGGGLRLDFGHLNAVAADDDALLIGLGMVRTPASLWWPLARERGLRLAARAGLGRLAQGTVDRWRSSPAVALGRRQAAGPALLGITPGNIDFRPGDEPRPGWTWAVVELRGDGRRRRARLVARHPAEALPAHNVVAHDGLVAVCDSARARVVGVDRRSGEIVRSVAIPGDFPFPRGLLRLADGRLAAGMQLPAAIAILDLDAECIDDQILLDDDHAETPYAIAAVPDGFADAAGRLPTTRAGWPIVAADAAGQSDSSAARSAAAERSGA